MLAWLGTLFAHLDPHLAFGSMNFLLDALRSFPLLWLPFHGVMFLYFAARAMEQKSKMFGVASIVSLLSVSRFTILLFPFYQSQAVAMAPSSRTMTILYANVLVGSADADQFMNYVAQYDPDVVGLVEVTSDFEERTRIAEKFPYKDSQPGLTTEGASVYAKYPVEAHEFNLAKGYFRSIGLLVKPPGEKPFDMFLLHAPPPHVDHDLSWRNKYYADLQTLVEGDNTVVFGDFNMTPFTRLYHDFIMKTGLRNSMHGFGPRPTWRFIPYPIFRTTIDQVLHGPEWQSLTFQVLPSIGSDHYPLVVKLARAKG